MKKTTNILAMAIIMIATQVYATVRTVSNSPSGGAQYSSLQAAFTAATTGDTLLLEGTNTNYHLAYGSRWNKQLTVIGIGFNPQKQTPQRSQITNNTSEYNFYAQAAGSGSKFYGIEFMNASSASIVFIDGGTFSNYLFENCKFNAEFRFNGQTASNITFKNCIFDFDNSLTVSFSTTPNSNILFTSCIFDGFVQGNSSIQLSSTFDHCLFLSTTQVALQNMQNTVIKNSIFMNNASSQSGTSTGNIYLNNISRLGTISNALPNAGNQSSTNPNFVSYTLASLYSTAHDYHLQAGSPAIGAADDGTDIGPHGGFSNFNESGEVLTVPIVRAINISNTTAAPNSTINVQIQATKPNDN